MTWIKKAKPVANWLKDMTLQLLYSFGWGHGAWGHFPWGHGAWGEGGATHWDKQSKPSRNWTKV